MLTLLLLFMKSTTENWIAWAIFFKNQPKKILTFVDNFTTYGAGLKTEAKITNHLGLGLKRPIKLTKENFAESSFMDLNTFY